MLPKSTLKTRRLTSPNASRPIRRAARRGFSIIELMVVLLLIGVLAGIATLALPQILGNSKADATRASMKVIEKALALYQMRANAYPATLEELVPNQLSSYEDTLDAWGRPIVFAVDTLDTNQQPRKWMLYSPGDNGVDDGGLGDDVVLYAPL